MNKKVALKLLSVLAGQSSIQSLACSPLVSSHVSEDLEFFWWFSRFRLQIAVWWFARHACLYGQSAQGGSWSDSMLPLLEQNILYLSSLTLFVPERELYSWQVKSWSFWKKSSESSHSTGFVLFDYSKCSNLSPPSNSTHCFATSISVHTKETAAQILTYGLHYTRHVDVSNSCLCSTLEKYWWWK